MTHNSLTFNPNKTPQIIPTTTVYPNRDQLQDPKSYMLNTKIYYLKYTLCLFHFPLGPCDSDPKTYHKVNLRKNNYTHFKNIRRTQLSFLMNDLHIFYFYFDNL